MKHTTSNVRCISYLLLLSSIITITTAAIDNTSSNNNLRGLKNNNDDDKSSRRRVLTSYIPQSDCTVQVAALLQIPDAPEMEEDEVFDCTMHEEEDTSSSIADISDVNEMAINRPSSIGSRPGGRRRRRQKTRKLSLSPTQRTTLQAMIRDGSLIPGTSTLKLSGVQVDIATSDYNGGGKEGRPEEIVLPIDMDISSKVSLNGRGSEEGIIISSKELNKDIYEGVKRVRQHHTIQQLDEDDTQQQVVHNNRFFNRNLQSSTTQQSQRRKLSSGGVTGTKPILVVKVIDSSGRARSETSQVISSDIFGPQPGTNTANIPDAVNLKSQLQDCSKGGTSTPQLIIQPGVTQHANKYVAPGTIEVTIDITLSDNDRYVIHDAITNAVEELLDISLPGPYEQVMYVIEKCYVGCGWAAYAYVNSWMSVYQAHYYKLVGVTVHELGHNFGLAHSGKASDGKAYTDHTGMMGNPLYSDDTGKMCYNAAKNWQIGWYDDRKAQLSPRNEASTWYTTKTLVGVADYKLNGNNYPVVLKLETGNSDDYYINFNRARGINSQNDEADDEVTIVKTGQNGVAYSQSWLQKSLQVGESHTLSSGFGSKSIVVKLLSIDKSDANMWKANVLVKDSRVNGNGSSPPTSQPTSQPTKNPTLNPVQSPTRFPTPQPSIKPTNKPTITPTNLPTSTPTPCPPSTVPFTIDLHSDRYPEEQAWSLTNVCTNSVQMSRDADDTGYNKINADFSDTFCIPQGRYIFTMTDSYGDGMCCSHGNGYFKVFYNDTQVMESDGRTFPTKDGPSSVQSNEFGDACPAEPTSQPSTSPTSKPTTIPPSEQPSKAPSKEPTSQPSKAPSLFPTSEPSKEPTNNPITTWFTSSPTTNKPTSSSPTMSPSMPPTTTSPTKQPSSQPSKAPSSQPSSQPTQQPITAQPSSSPSRSLSSFPTTSSGCGADMIMISVNMTTDTYPEENTWILNNTCTGEVEMTLEQMRPIGYDKIKADFSDTFCVPKGKYTFTMNDTYGDGMCYQETCGSYTVSVDGVTTVSVNGDEFTWTKVDTFGSCPVNTPTPSQQPTQVPTQHPTPAPDQVAIFDNDLRVPKCSDVGQSCESGNSIIKTGNDEPYYVAGMTNTLDTCKDGMSGTYQSDESIEKITVRTVNGGQLVEGARVRIEAYIHAFQEGEEDTIDFYYTNTADLLNPSWNYIGSKEPSRGGFQTLSIEYTLPAGGMRQSIWDSSKLMQAVRVNIRWRGGQYSNSCSGGNYDDVDDMVFTILKSDNDISEETMDRDQAISAKSYTCETIQDSGRCREDSSCRWRRYQSKCQPRRGRAPR